MSDLDRRAILAGAGVLGTAALAGIARAGPLNPPSGAVAGTSKPLGEIEPRIAVNATNTPGAGVAIFRITQPGSYYLTGDVIGVSGLSGIIITASDVTLDLNGFRVQGVAGSFIGISHSGSGGRVTIRNGTVSGWGASGVSVSSGASALIEQVTVSLNGGGGISVVNDAFVRDCFALSNTGQGISVGSRCVVIDCRAAFNMGAGISTAGQCQLVGCIATQNTSTTFAGIVLGSFSSLVNCLSYGNTLDGISLGNVCECLDSNASSNGGYGFRTANDVNVSRCYAGNNTLAGILANFNVRVDQCVLSQNNTHGIEATSQCSITNNTCRNNGIGAGVTNGAGIFIASPNTVSVVDSNHCVVNDVGIRIEGTNNFIRRNVVSASAVSNYIIAAGNRTAPIVTPPSTTAVSGSTGGSGLGTTDPWANLAL
jgi:hypothetical protein